LTRLFILIKLIYEKLGKYDVNLNIVKHEVKDDIEYFDAEITIPEKDLFIEIREYLVKGKIVSYGYYLRMRDYMEWWDNRPHHPEIGTYPDHKHIDGKVEPLHNPSFEAFIEHVVEIIKKRQ